MENFNNRAEVEQVQVAPQKPKNNDRKNYIIGVLTILGLIAVVVLLTNGKKKETKRVRVIKKTKTIVKNKKGEVDEETNEDEDDNETDENGNDNGNDDSDNGNDDSDNGK